MRSAGAATRALSPISAALWRRSPNAAPATPSSLFSMPPTHPHLLCHTPLCDAADPTHATTAWTALMDLQAHLSFPAVPDRVAALLADPDYVRARCVATGARSSEVTTTAAPPSVKGQQS